LDSATFQNGQGVVTQGKVIATLHAPVTSGTASTHFDIAGLPAGRYRIHAVNVSDPAGGDFTGSSDRSDGTLAVVGM
jgi:hypothetical protein